MALLPRTWRRRPSRDHSGRLPSGGAGGASGRRPRGGAGGISGVGFVGGGVVGDGFLGGRPLPRPRRRLRVRPVTVGCPAALLAVVCALGFLAGVRPAAATVVAGSYGWPVPLPHPVLRGFEAPASEWGPGHRGVDVGAAGGSTVVAAGAGTVTFAAVLAGRGVVVVAHPDGLRTTYEPLVPAVRVGARVARGDPLGRLALAGGHCLPRACLHWGALRGAAYLDPLTLLGLGGPVRLLPLGPGGDTAADDGWAGPGLLPLAVGPARLQPVAALPLLVGAAPLQPADPPLVGGAAPLQPADPPLVGGAAPLQPADPPLVGGAAPLQPADPPLVGGAAPLQPAGLPLAVGAKQQPASASGPSGAGSATTAAAGLGVVTILGGAAGLRFVRRRAPPV